MTHSNIKKQGSILTIASKLSLAAYVVSLLMVGSVSANEQDKNQSVIPKNPITPEQVQLMDWSKKLTASLNDKMEKQLQQIIIQAEYLRLLDINNLVGSSPKATPSLQNGTYRPGIPLFDQ